jgi:hypothetical protein
MSLADKYKIPESSIKAMVKDGVIPWGVVRQEQFVTFYKKTVDSGIEKYEAVKLTAEEFNVSKQYIYRIIQQLS